MSSIPAFNSLALGENPAHRVSAVQKGALAAFALGLLACVVALASDLGATHPIPMLTLIGVLTLGGDNDIDGGLWLTGGYSNLALDRHALRIQTRSYSTTTTTAPSRAPGRRIMSLR